jgi:hypothetical protein
LKISLGIQIAVFLGIVLLMAAKPELWESISIVGTSVAFGLLTFLLAWRRSGSLSAPRADIDDANDYHYAQTVVSPALKPMISDDETVAIELERPACTVGIGAPA